MWFIVVYVLATFKVLTYDCAQIEWLHIPFPHLPKLGRVRNKASLIYCGFNVLATFKVLNYDIVQSGFIFHSHTWPNFAEFEIRQAWFIVVLCPSNIQGTELQYCTEYFIFHSHTWPNLAEFEIRQAWFIVVYVLATFKVLNYNIAQRGFIFHSHTWTNLAEF